MRLEERVTSKELDEDAPNTPNIAWIAPAQVEYDLRCSVVPCRNNSGVILIVKGGRSKVDKSDLSIK